MANDNILLLQKGLFLLIPLQELLPERPTASITYFVPDERKSGGSYQTVTGEVKRIDTVAGVIQMVDWREIPIEDVFSVEIVP